MLRTLCTSVEKVRYSHLQQIVKDESLEIILEYSHCSIKTCCGYSLEVLQQGTSDEYLQHMSLWRTRLNTLP